MFDERVFDGKYVRLTIDGVDAPDALRTNTRYVLNTTGKFLTSDDPEDLRREMQTLLIETMKALDVLNERTSKKASMAKGLEWALAFTIDSLDRGDHEDYSADEIAAADFVAAVRWMFPW